MTEKHVNETTESRWQIWRAQSAAIVVGGFVLLLSCGCGWMIGVTG